MFEFVHLCVSVSVSVCVCVLAKGKERTYVKYKICMCLWVCVWWMEKEEMGESSCYHMCVRVCVAHLCQGVCVRECAWILEREREGAKKYLYSSPCVHSRPIHSLKMHQTNNYCCCIQKKTVRDEREKQIGRETGNRDRGLENKNPNETERMSRRRKKNHT